MCDVYGVIICKGMFIDSTQRKWTVSQGKGLQYLEKAVMKKGRTGISLLQYLQDLINAEGGRLAVEPLQVRVGLLLNLLGPAHVPLGEQRGNVARLCLQH